MALLLATLGASLPGCSTAAAAAGCAPMARQPAAPFAFMGFACVDPGCAEHKAGFAWAERAGLGSAAGCARGGTPRWQEGCRAFVRDAVTPEQSGFQWARANEIGDPCLCQGAGPRFQEGCEAYVVGFGG